MVQVHNLPNFLVFAALTPKLTGVQVILDLHGLMPEFYAERYHRSLDSLPGSVIEAGDNGCLRLIYHGTIDRQYGLDLALRAINLVRQTASNVHLTIHGGGEHRQTLIW